MQHADSVFRLTISAPNAAIANAAAAGFCGDAEAGRRGDEVGVDEPTGLRVSAAIGRDGVLRYFEHTPEGLSDGEIK